MMRSSKTASPHRTSRVQSLDRGLAILDTLANAGGSMTVQDLARALNLSPSTVSRLTATLRDHQLVTQDGGASGYRLGLELVRYARIASMDHPLATSVGPVIEQLVASLDETVSLSIPTEQGMLYVRSDAPEGHIVTIRISVGNTLPYTTTAAGKAVLAAQPPEALARIIEHGLTRRTDASVTNEPEFMAQIATIRQQGYAVEVGESSAEVACVAVAIRGRRGDVVGALSCNIPAVQASPDRIEHIARRLAEASSEAESALHRLSSGSGLASRRRGAG